MKGAREKRIELVEAQDFESITGKGVVGKVEGRSVALGNTKLLEQLGIAAGTALESADRMRKEGETVMFVAVDGRLAGLVGVADPTKDIQIGQRVKVEFEKQDSGEYPVPVFRPV